MIIKSISGGICLTVLGVLGFTAGGSAQMLLQDVSAQAGLQAAHSANKPSCGQAIADVNNNGRQDVFVTGYFQPNQLYLNNGNGTFSLSALSTQLSPAGANCGPTAFADYNNDGWADVYIACDGDNFLMMNDRFNRFVDVTASAGVNHAHRSEAVAWADINNDGWLDLYVGTYPPSSTPDIDDPANWDHLWLNNQDGSFTNISQVLDRNELTKPVLAATFSDLDNDGDLDLYVVNDKLVGNTMWRNDGPGCGGWCFTDVSDLTNTDRQVYGMGIAAGDVDLDGDLDLYFSSIAEQVLLRNDLEGGSWVYTEISNQSGLNFDAVGWGTHFLDLDNDRWLDAYLATGGTDLPVNTDRVYHNQGSMVFDDISGNSGASNPLNTNGASQLDYDRDGLQDLIVCNNSSSYVLYQNQSTQTGNWLTLQLKGGGVVNRDAIGARVTVTSGEPAVAQMRDVTSGQSRGGNSSFIQHFGLGEDTAAAIEIRWPDGVVTEVEQVGVNREYLFFHPNAEQRFSNGFE